MHGRDHAKCRTWTGEAEQPGPGRFSGSAGVIGRLRKEGDRVDDKMNLIGMFPTTPLLEVASTNLTDSARCWTLAHRSTKPMPMELRSSHGPRSRTG